MSSHSSRQPQRKNPIFQPGDFVSLRQDPQKRGVISGPPVAGPNGWQHKVFFSDALRQLAEVDLRPVVEFDIDSTGEIRYGKISDLLRHLVLAKLQNPQTNALYSYNASRTQFEPYQFKPCLKFLRNPDQRLLIADEVGLGKTIEAGIILLELQARLDMSRVLVVCPSGLRTKWRDEMRSRFDETFTILTRESLTDFIHKYQTYQSAERLKGIISLEAVRRPEIANALVLAQVRFDLVVIDEAHHLRNTATQSNEIGHRLSSLADAMLLLTATPINLGDENLFQLLRILAPEEFDDLAAFRLRLEPNRHINMAARLLEAGKAHEASVELNRVETTSEKRRFRGNPFYAETQRLLTQHFVSPQDMVTAQRRLLELNTLATIFTRTRKREVMHTGVPQRKAYTIPVYFSPQEQRFYDAVLAYVRNQYSLLTGNSWIPAWAVMMRARQAASCISAMRERLADEISGELPESAEDEAVYQELGADDDGDGEVSKATTASANLLRAAQAVGATDSKFTAFQTALQSAMAEDAKAGKKSKILVFSFFKGTLAYLYRRLRQTGVRLELISGDVDVAVRQQIVEDFRDNPDITILLSSEVGAEGLDFQFCDTLFNYDLPWNPMKVEQRIGRIDRYGQKSQRVRIYNLVIKGTIEERIFLRLFERIRIFEEAIGDLEAILGEEIRTLSKSIFRPGLTPKEEQELVEKAAITIERRKQDLEEFDTQRLSFMGQDKILQQQVDEAIESGRFVSQAEVHALVATFVQQRFPMCRLETNGDGTYAMRLHADFIQYMILFCGRALVNDQTAQDFLRRLHLEARLRLTFAGAIAYERKLLEFVTVRHPLAQAAAEFWRLEAQPVLPMASVVINAEPELAGDYFFFIYLFEVQAAEPQVTLKAFVVSDWGKEFNPELSSRFLRFIQAAYPATDDKDLFLDVLRSRRFPGVRQMVEEMAAAEHEKQTSEVNRLNAALVNARLAALSQTYKIKRERVESLIGKVREVRIRRMHESQLRGIDAKYATKVEAIKQQREIVVSHRPILAGLARIKPG